MRHISDIKKIYERFGITADPSTKVTPVTTQLHMPMRYHDPSVSLATMGVAIDVPDITS